MTLYKVLVMGLYLLGTTTLAQGSAAETCLRIEGTVIDYLTKQPLSDAELFIKLSTGRQKVSLSNESGKFIANVKCEATAILIERTGYRSQILSLSQPRTAADKQAIVIYIPLVAIDRQSTDRPYLQTEQTDFVQQSSEIKAVKSGSTPLQHGLFKIKDAISKAPLQAKSCFFFTKNGRKKCLTSDTKGQFKLDFGEADIVAVEVSSPGYQTYEGNLIVELVDGRSLTHEICLQRELTVLAIQANDVIRCEVRSKNNLIALVSESGHSGWFTRYDLIPGPYDLVITRRTHTSHKAINILKGLNYKFLPTPKSNNAPITPARIASTAPTNSTGVPTSLLNLPDSIPMIYFEQGSYQLRADSQDVLKNVAQYLKGHQNYSVQITGHTDNVGDERLNKSLSEFRAAVAATFLARQGIPDEKLLKVGHGSRYPISPNDTEVNKALNRRVSLKLIAIQ